MCQIGMPKRIPFQKIKQLFGWNRQPDKRIGLTVSFMFSTKVCKFNKKTDYKYMSLFFYPCPHELQELLRRFSCV